MKILKYLSILGLGLATVSCNRIETATPRFEVSINKTTFNVGDTAKFKFSGTPANIIFYSGLPGNDYDSRNTYKATGGIPQMTFTTGITAATGSSTATNLNVLVSNDFNGKYNQTDILAATWTPIPNVLIPGAAQTIILTPYVAEGKPLYVAFRFQTVDPTKSQRLVTISNFSFKTVYPNKTYINANYVYDAGFASFDFAGATGKWQIPMTSVTNNSFTHPLVAANSEVDDDWAISKAMETNAVLPSVGVALKSISNDILTDYEYIFTKPGTYKMVIVASNSTNKDYKETVKEFTVKVN